MSYFHRDVVCLVPSRSPIVGWDAVKTYYDGIHIRYRKDGRYLYLKAVTHQVVVSGDWAWTYGETYAVRCHVSSRRNACPRARRTAGLQEFGNLQA
jgi:hypothetical protein